MAMQRRGMDLVAELRKALEEGDIERYDKLLCKRSAEARERIKLMEEGSIYDEAHMNERCTE